MRTCENCKREYIPVLGERDPNRPIQEQFPDAEPWEREQLSVLGFCSDECFDKYLGVEGYVYTDGKRFVLTPMGSRRALYVGDPILYCPHCEDTELWEMKEPTPSGHTHQCPDCKTLHAPYGLNE